MRKLIFCCLYLGAGLFAQAQTQLVSAGGKSDINASGILSWSVGEVAIGQANGPSGELSEGFHRATITIQKLVTSVEQEELFMLQVYPNPTASLLNIKLPANGNGIQYRLHGLNGQQALEGQVPSGNFEHTINLSPLSSGTYILIVSDEMKGLSTTYKIIKSN